MIFKFGKYQKSPDYFLVSIFIFLISFGLIILSSASSDIGKIRFNDTYYYFGHQIKYGLLLGIIGATIGYYIPLKWLRNIALPFFITTLALLALVLFSQFGVSYQGSTRWLQIGKFTFQPSELLKVSFIMYLSAWLSNPRINRGHEFARGFLPFILLSALASGLLILQPATSAVVILLSASALTYFISGARAKYLIGLILLSGILLISLIYFTPYRFDRVKSFFSENSDPLGKTYHFDQAITAIGSGGLNGVGYGKSGTKYKYLPESIGDSIFAITAEEFGFIGVLLTLTAFLFLIIRGFQISYKLRDDYAKYLMTGLTSLIGLQAFMNIAAISGFIPLTGVTLPFVSYGGTSLATFMIIAGIMLNLSRRV